MKKYTVLIAFIIGLAVFLMRWFRAYAPIENYQVHFLPLFGIYFGMRLYFKKIKTDNPDYKITFLPVFSLGVIMSLVASVITCIFCLLFVQYPANDIKFFSPLHLYSLPFLSTASYGVLISILCAAVIVYFKPIKAKPDTHFKWHTGHFIY